MHAQPPRILKRLIKQYGPDLVNDPRRTESLLNDLCGRHRREIFVLVNAQKQRVPAELLAAPTWMPRQATWARLSRQLQEKLAITEDAADWAVAAWADALDLVPTAGKAGWPWQNRPETPPATTAATQRKSRKRQSGQVDVQYQAEPTSKSKRRPLRGARAETRTDVRSLIWFHLAGEPVAKLVVWGAILLVSVSLLVVVVNAMTRPAAIEELPSAAEPMQETESTAVPAAAGADRPGDGTQNDHDLLNSLVALPRTAWVTEGPLLLRQGPSTADGYLAALDAKTGVTVIEFSPDGAWSHIALPNDGWVSNQFLSFLTDGDAKELVQLQVHRETVTAPLVIHALPHPDSAEVAQLDAGDPLVTVAITLDGVWRQTAEPVVGWVAAPE